MSRSPAGRQGVARRGRLHDERDGLQILKGATPYLRRALVLAAIGTLTLAGIRPTFAGDASKLAIMRLGFASPPASARPRVWWEWMNGNVRSAGITLDLDWMHRIGIGGVTNVEVGFECGCPFDVPPLVAAPVVYGSGAWEAVVRDSMVRARQLGLEFSVDTSAGWSQSGGPWVKPEEGMKKLVWSETRIHGRRRFVGKLSQPPETTGIFQNIPLADLSRRAFGTRVPVFYSDVAVIAYRTPRADTSLDDLEPVITSSSGPLKGRMLWDGDLATYVSLPDKSDQDAWIQYSFKSPQRVQALTLVVGPTPVNVNPALETHEGGWLGASDDGAEFRKIADLPTYGAPEQTIAFVPVVARVFRVFFLRPGANALQKMQFTAVPTEHQIAELVLHTGARVNRFEDKAGFSSRQIRDEDDTPPLAGVDAIRISDVVNLTDRMSSDGTLTWDVPTGNWTVLRFGYSLTGSINLSAPHDGRGLEVDKLNAIYVKRYIEKYLATYDRIAAQADGAGANLQALTQDSFEAGAQNWTDGLLDQFRSRRRYDATGWLPVLAGRVIASSAASDRFLWDFRKTLGELMAEAHYGEIAAAARRRGLSVYRESQENGRAFIGDGMEAKKTADIPMGAMWAATVPGYYAAADYDADIKESASVAHLYGRQFVAAESFTAIGHAYSFAPADLKPLADREMAMGVNRFVIHASVHQPDSRIGPGISIGSAGQWFTRKETWAEQAGTWIAYLTRSSYLLQQGKFVADIAYLYGEDTNITSLFNTSEVPIPDGFSFDFVDPNSLLREFSVRNGQLVTRSGMQYRVLVLDPSTRRISLTLLRKIRELVRSGAMVVGSRPEATPSLMDDEAEFRTLVADLWEGKSADTSPSIGKISRKPLQEVLSAMQLDPDVVFDKSYDGGLRFVHRSLPGAEVYFLSNGSERSGPVSATFRARANVAELWRADAGTVHLLPSHLVAGRTALTLDLKPHDAVFVVLSSVPSGPVQTDLPFAARTLGELAGPWEVRFPPNLGAPAQTVFGHLVSWTESQEAGVRYFSGTASYNHMFEVRKEWIRDGSRLHVNLGRVENVAEILVNGKSVAVLWEAPYDVDITDSVGVGNNQLQIRVTNLWPNRLIGDKQPGANKIASATFDPFEANSALLPSGLLGPVQLTLASMH